MSLERSSDLSEVYDLDWQSVIKQVGTSQVKLSVGANSLSERQLVVIKNVGTNPLFIGPAGVSTTGASKGDEIGPDETISFNFGPNIDVYAIAESASNDVLIWEMS